MPLSKQTNKQTSNKNLSKKNKPATKLSALLVLNYCRYWTYGAAELSTTQRRLLTAYIQSQSIIRVKILLDLLNKNALRSHFQILSIQEWHWPLVAMMVHRARGFISSLLCYILVHSSIRWDCSETNILREWATKMKNTRKAHFSWQSRGWNTKEWGEMSQD